MHGMWIASNSPAAPPNFTTLVIDEAQAAKLLAQLEARAEDRDAPTEPTEPTEYFESHFLRRDEPMLEYACREANYSLVHILEGARERDRHAVR
jgi:hypothetical protein